MPYRCHGVKLEFFSEVFVYLFVYCGELGDAMWLQGVAASSFPKQKVHLKQYLGVFSYLPPTLPLQG